MDLEFAFNLFKVEGMWCLFYMLVTLCVGDKGVYSVQPEFALSGNIGKNKLNFGYGVNFKYNGEIHNNLDRVWVVQRFNLPKGLTSYFTGMKFGLNCEYKNLSPQSTGKTWAIDAVSRVSFIREVCRQTRPMLAQLEKGAYFYQKTIERLVNGDIPNALHKLPVVEEIRYRRSNRESDNPDKHVTPEHLQAGKPGNTHVEKVYTNTSLSKQAREKRGILGIALPIVGKIATIAIEALGSHLQKKRRRAMAKALGRMESSQFLTKNLLYKLDKDFLMFGDYEIQTTDGMIKLLGNLNNRTLYLERIITGQDPNAAKNYLKDTMRGTEIFSHQVQMYMQAMRERYLRVPENLINELKLLLRSIVILSRGYLPPQLFSPTDIVRISQAALLMIKNKHPDYVLAIPQASSYYDMRLVTFGIDENDRLVVCFPIFVKDFSRKSMTLYQIETVPVPILDTNVEASSYSQAVINKPYIATNNDYYIQLEIEELFMCKQIKHIYFCEELFLVKHKTKHSCESALFYDLKSALVKQNCQFKYFYNTTVIPSVLDGGSEIVLANMLNEKRLICTYDQGLAKPLPASPYVLVDRRILCHCHIQSGLTYVLKNIGSCNSTDQPVLYYTVNLAFLNYFSSFLNDSDEIPSNPMEDEQVLPIAMEDFSKDPDFSVYCQDSSMFPTYLDQLVHIATNNDYYIQLEIEELFMCKQIKHIYFCEELFLVKHKTKHSCESALFYDLKSALVKQNCQFKYFYNTTVIPSVLDGGSEIVLANMLNEKRLICTYDQGLAKPLPASPYVLVDRRILCHCHIQSGLTYVLKNIGSCNSTDQPVLYYTLNLAFLNYFSSFLNDSDEIPSNPMEDEQVLPIAMEDFSKDPNFSVYCQDSSMFPTYLDQLVHVHYQKKLFRSTSNKKW